MTTWVIIANASVAKIYAVNKIKFINGSQKLALVREFSHPQSRMRDADIVTDKVGRYRSKNSRSDSFNEPTDPKEHEADAFALQLAKYLEEEKSHKHYEDLILVSSPSFSGMLNSHLSPKIKKVVSLNIEKDYTKDSDKDLEKHLKQQIG